MIAIDKIIRTRRRTLALIVERDGKLSVRAPMRAKEDAIHEFVEDKEKWILAKQQQARARSMDFVTKQYVRGEEFLYLGNHYRLELVDTKKPALALDTGFRLAHAAVPRAVAVFERWYRARAFQVISERVEWYAAKHGFDYRQVKITAARRQWGSCGAQGNLRFAWRLVMAPMQIIDYVVVHELVHLQHRNHSKRFWGKVMAILPDFKQRISWLEENGYLLNLE
jgi:hypothetical protein